MRAIYNKIRPPHMSTLTNVMFPIWGGQIKSMNTGVIEIC